MLVGPVCLLLGEILGEIEFRQLCWSSGWFVRPLITYVDRSGLLLGETPSRLCWSVRFVCLSVDYKIKFRQVCWSAPFVYLIVTWPIEYTIPHTQHIHTYYGHSWYFFQVKKWKVERKAHSKRQKDIFRHISGVSRRRDTIQIASDSLTQGLQAFERPKKCLTAKS